MPDEEVVATFRLPLPVAGLTEATQGLREMYGDPLHLAPFEPGDDFVRVVRG